MAGGAVDQDTLRGEAGQYRIYELIASGGFGSVFFGRNTATNVPVGVKRLQLQHKGQRDIVERFEREAALVRGLAHPNIVRLLDQGRDERGVPFLVMEWVEGLTVGDWLDQRGRFRPSEAADVACQALEGLQAAWDRRIVHRDIKPANLMVTPVGRVKVMDFGVAKGGDQATLTGVGGLVGTPAYMAPEQLRGEPLDCRADLYALGATLYRMLAGRPPFEGPSLTDFFRQHLEQDIPPLDAACPDLEPDLAAVVQTALAKRPEDRFATPAEMLAALRPFAVEEPHSATVTVARWQPSSSSFTPRSEPVQQVTPHPALLPKVVLPATGVALVAALTSYLLLTGVVGGPSRAPTPVVPTPTAQASGILLQDTLENLTTIRLPKASPQPANFVVGCCSDGYLIQKINPGWQDVASVGLPGIYSDASLAVDARLIDATANRFVALSCRDQPAGGAGYRLIVAPASGQVSLARIDGTSRTSLADVTGAQALHRGDEINHLELICAGTNIAARINGVQVASARDETHREGALLIGAGADPGGPLTVEVHFKTLVVSRP